MISLYKHIYKQNTPSVFHKVGWYNILAYLPRNKMFMIRFRKVNKRSVMRLKIVCAGNTYHIILTS